MSDSDIILIPKEGNPNYPLPLDYFSPAWTDEARRQARVNACRQWLIRHPRTAEGIAARADAYVAGLWFFDTYYLWPDESADFNPVFYDDPPLESPAAHWEIARQWISYRRNVTVANRGIGKSKLNEKDMMFRLLSRPAYSFIYATATHDLTRGVGENMRRQFRYNKRLRDDFDPFARSLTSQDSFVPRRTDGSFSAELMMLTTGSWIRLLSAQSKQRGGRPRRYRLDDPEYDPSASTSMSTLRDYVEDLLFKIVIPMVTRPDTGVDWIGTFVSRRHYLYAAMEMEETPDGPRAKDHRFDRWSRLNIPAELIQDGRRVSVWPAMWPATREDRLRMAETNPIYHEAESLEEVELSIGTANYNSEYRNKPGESADNFFGTITRDKHGYWFENTDDSLALSPRTSHTLICYYEFHDNIPHLQKVPLSEFLRRNRLFMTGDTSFTAKSSSDYKVCTLFAVTSNNDLFVLDLWSGQCQEALLVKHTFRIADLWLCPSIHVEAIKDAVSLYNSLDHIVRTRANDMAGTKHLPSIHKLNVGVTSKEGKISGLLFRFEHGKMKLPLWRSSEHQWSRLFNQIDEFNPDVAAGGLQHDDELDTISMSQFVLRGRLSRAAPDPNTPKTLKQRLIDNDHIDESGVNIAHGLDLSRLSYTDIQEILSARTHPHATHTTPSKI